MNVTHSLRAYPRLHFGLVDLSGATRRAYGGVGVSFDGPSIMVESDASPRLDLELEKLDAEARKSVVAALTRCRMLGLSLTGQYRIAQQIPSHVGLGSTTATTLAMLQSIATINLWSLTAADLIALSGRGRTSAIGSNTFFEGGIVADAGQSVHPIDAYVPSMLSQGRPASLRLGRWSMPKEWTVYLLFATEAPSVSPDREGAFFASASPTKRIDTFIQLSSVYHGILPAILERDLESFANSLREFQSRGFKAREIAVQPAHVRRTLRRVWDEGFAAGLSSFGPTVFIVSTGTTAGLQQLVPKDSDISGPFAFRDRGFDQLT
jgi:beta-ribofuranosylaminobenzene 5'-phosphate synthase